MRLIDFLTEAAEDDQPLTLNDIVHRLQKLNMGTIEVQKDRIITVRTTRAAREETLQKAEQEFTDEGAFRTPPRSYGSSLGAVKIGNDTKNAFIVTCKPIMGGDGRKGTLDGTERQELGLINAINDNIGLKIGSLGFALTGVSKKEGTNSQGNEPYIDIELHTDGKTYGVSCKGTTAPSLGGGGARGLSVLVPKFFDEAFDRFAEQLKKLNLKNGDIIPASKIKDVFVEIPDDEVDTIIRGTSEIGGPIDYMYVGPLDVESSVEGNKLVLNGEFIAVEDYIKKVGKFYLRFRKRDLNAQKTVKIAMDIMDKDGRPRLFVNPDNDAACLRVVVTDVPSENAWIFH